MTDHKALAEQAVSIDGMRKAFQRGESLGEIAEVAQVHATLYLAEQQRIANLIALASSDSSSLASVGQDALTEMEKRGEGFYSPRLRPEIREGLGLS